MLSATQHLSTPVPELLAGGPGAFCSVEQGGLLLMVREKVHSCMLNPSGLLHATRP